MRRLAFAALSAFWLLAALSGHALANFDLSKGWFNGLTPDQRSDTQANLTLLGYYQYLVDGQFGKGTYDALTAFQRSIGRPSTGVLSAPEQDTLLVRAAQVYNELGMDLVEDQQAQSAIILPAGLLSVQTPGKKGNIYATPDGGISLETMRRPTNETSFSALFEEMKASGADRSVTYSSANTERFVVTGTESGRPFYSFFRNAETESVGYTVRWTAPNEDRASMLAIFIASHFAPLRLSTLTEETRKADTMQTNQRFGVFYLPANSPDVIYLNGEIGATLGPDFYRALQARPEATVLMLNSPGGYVDAALSVAHEVRRRGMDTIVAKGSGCYSACSYIFFAGQPRYVEGELGVHQISAEVADLVLAQTTLSDVLDALDQFGVEQVIITQMLRTPPEKMYVFSPQEVADLRINEGGSVVVPRIDLATLETNIAIPAELTQVTLPATQTGAAYVQLSSQTSPTEADRSLAYAVERWASILGSSKPEIFTTDGNSGPIYRIAVAALSLENANAICAAIKSAGGGCYVTQEP